MMPRVLFATAELAPVASVGGLASAAAGLVGELRRQGVDVAVVLPDYSGVELEGEHRFSVDVPAWAGPASVRVGRHAVVGELHLVDVPGVARSHPYLAHDGHGWQDNDARFLAFSAAVAALWREVDADVLHLNDWHTAAALGALEPPAPSVLSIHNLAYQGTCDGSWLARLGPHAGAYEWWGACNPLKGGLLLADVVVAVSPTYAREIVEPAGGFGLHDVLRSRAGSLRGILNGIDTTVWDPRTDVHLRVAYGPDDLAAKAVARRELLAELGLRDDGAPLAVMVTRLTEQKGTDLLPGLVRFLDRLPLRLAVLGAGDATTAAALHRAAAAHEGSVAFVEGYDEGLSHRLFAAGDLLVMPSRFEPCGLSQMQAMAYGTLPVVTDVGGLHDTVVDLDADPHAGIGVVVDRATESDLVDGLHRAVRAVADPARKAAAQARGMAVDWSWRAPALAHLELYREVIARR